MTLADFVKRRRGQLAISQAGVAKASGGLISSVSVCDIENGRSVDIKVSMVVGLAKALRVKPEIILAAAQESMA